MSGLPAGMELAEQAARKHNWDVVKQTRSGHWLWKAPSGAVVATAGTPSRSTTILNDISRLRRAGLPVPRKGQKKKAKS